MDVSSTVRWERNEHGNKHGQSKEGDMGDGGKYQDMQKGGMEGWRNRVREEGGGKTAGTVVADDLFLSLQFHEDTEISAHTLFPFPFHSS